MPWKEPGKGDNDPWKSGEQQPPDLDEVFRNLRSRFRSIFGGGSGRSGGAQGGGTGGTGGLLPLLLLVVVFWGVWDAVHIIDEAERGVVTRFGEYNRTLDPGINLTLPRPVEALTKVNVSNIRSVEDRGNMLTEDENLVDLNYSVQYRVADPEKFLFRVRDPEATLQSAAESALRESVGTNRLDFILGGEGRFQVGNATQNVLQDTLDLYNAGIQVTKFNLKDATVPPQVRDAFSDVNKAREDRQRFIEEAQVHANSVIPEARGQAARVLEEAEGYRESTIALAEGEASRFEQLYKEYEAAPAITRKRLYLQAMEGVLSRSKKVLIDADSGNNVLYLPIEGSSGGNLGASQRIIPPMSGDDNVSAAGERGGTGVRNPNREVRR